MPYKHTLCAKQGCPNDATVGKFCSIHAARATADYNRNYRRPGTRQLYGRRWVAIRNLYISQHPLCEKCLEAGRYTPATEVHHILPLDRGGSNDDENLMSLCKPCHSSITISETRSR